MKLLVHSRAAFTFVEILAALTFMGILMPVVISAIMSANRAGITSERSMIAAELGENQMSQLMVNNAWSSGASSGDFGAQYPGYRWTTQQADWQSGSMTQLTLNVTFQVQGVDTTVPISTLVNNALTTGT